MLNKMPVILTSVYCRALCASCALWLSPTRPVKLQELTHSTDQDGWSGADPRALALATEFTFLPLLAEVISTYLGSPFVYYEL